MSIKNLILKTISLLMALTIVLSFAACKKSDNKNKDKDKTPQKSQSTEISTNDDISDIELEPEDEYDITFARPVTLGGISTGVMPNRDYETDIDEFEDWDDGEWDDLIDFEPTSDYEPLIKPTGSKASGSKRVITVNNSKKGIVYKDFNGLGANIYPTFTSFDSQINTGTNPAYQEINAKRWNDFNAYYTRSWFNVDWMITNEIEKNGENYEDYYGKNEQNPDYINYINGVYDFDSDMMNSCYDYYKMLEEAGTEIYLNFGWKVSLRIADWFSLAPEYANSSAPRDLDAYSGAAAALFKHLKNNVGLTNVNTIAFYNEPNSVKRIDGDFASIGDKRVVWVNMVKAIHKKFKADKDLKDVLIVSADCSDDVKYTTNFVTPYLKEKIPDLLDIWSFHYYYGADPINTKPNPKSPYLSMVHNATFVSNYYNEHPVYFTEYYACSYDVKEDNKRLVRYCWDTFGFEGTECSYFIALANNGIHGGLSWGVVGGWIPFPTSLNLSNDECSAWYIPKDEESTNNTNYNYYERSLLNTYVKHHSNVHNVEWTGEDMHVSAFTSKNGKDFTLIVETKEKTKEKDLTVNLKDSLDGKNINVFRMAYDITVKPDGNATVPSRIDSLLNVNKQIKYKLAGGYNIYVFTTYSPLKQIELFKENGDVAVHNECDINGSIKIRPAFVDNSETVSKNTVKWEIKRYSKALTVVDGIEQPYEVKTTNLGSLDVDANGTVTYTPASDAKVGDVIAIRCSLKSDPTRFASAMIVITE